MYSEIHLQFVLSLSAVLKRALLKSLKIRWNPKMWSSLQVSQGEMENTFLKKCSGQNILPNKRWLILPRKFYTKKINQLEMSWCRNKVNFEFYKEKQQNQRGNKCVGVSHADPSYSVFISSGIQRTFYVYTILPILFIFGTPAESAARHNTRINSFSPQRCVYFHFSERNAKNEIAVSSRCCQLLLSFTSRITSQHASNLLFIHIYIELAAAGNFSGVKNRKLKTFE